MVNWSFNGTTKGTRPPLSCPLCFWVVLLQLHGDHYFKYCVMPTDKCGRSSENTLPSNNKKKKQTMCTCSICDLVIHNDKGDAILCKSKCQAWLHRYCTGMSKQMFSVLAKSDQPFIVKLKTDNLKGQVNTLTNDLLIGRA